MVIKNLNHLLPTVDLSYTEILLQDDASPDYDLRELVGWPPFKVMRNDTNLGFIRNVNTLAARAKGDYLIVLNQDARALTPGWADYMVAMMHDNQSIGLVGPKLIFPGGGGIQSCGGIFDARKNPWHRYLGWKNIEDRRVNTTEKVSWITGACFVVRSNEFRALGGLNDRDYIGGYWDDVDLCMRIRYELGKEIWYYAGAVFEHTVGSAGGGAYFKHNMQAFHRIWDDKIVPDTTIVYANW